MKLITKKLSVLALSCFSILGFTLAGCTDESGSFNIELLDKTEWTDMYGNEEYDVLDIIEEEKGASYSINQLFYFDENFVRHDIEEHGKTTFTQTESYDVIVEIKGKKGKKTDYEVVELDLCYPPQRETGITFEGPFTTYFGGEKSSAWSKTGLYSCHVKYDAGSSWVGYAGFVCDYELEDENTITFSMKSDEALSKKDDYLGIYLLTSTGKSVSFEIDILAGEHDYEFELTAKNEKNGRNLPTNTTIVSIAFYTTETANVYVDDIKFIKKDIDYVEPEPEVVELITFDTKNPTIRPYYGGVSATEWKASGENSWKLTPDGGWTGYAGFQTEYAVGTVNTMSVTVNSSAAISKNDGLYINGIGTSGVQQSWYFPFEVEAGIKSYEFSLTGIVQDENLSVLCVAMYVGTETVYIDDVKFFYEERTETEPSEPENPVNPDAQWNFEEVGTSSSPIVVPYYGGEQSSDWKASGEKSWLLSSDNTWESYAGLETNFLVGKVNTMKVTVNSTGAISRADGIYLNVLTSEGQKSAYYKFEVQADVHEYEITLDSTTEKDGKDILQDDNCTILQVAFFTNGETVYIDDLSFVQK